MRSATRPDSAAETAASIGPGANARPACNAEYRHTPVRKRTLPSSSPAKPAKNRNVARLASENVGERRRSSARTGSRWRRDRATSIAPKPTAAARHTSDPPVPAPVRPLRDP